MPLGITWFTREAYLPPSNHQTKYLQPRFIEYEKPVDSSLLEVNNKDIAKLESWISTYTTLKIVSTFMSDGLALATIIGTADYLTGNRLHLSKLKLKKALLATIAAYFAKTVIGYKLDESVHGLSQKLSIKQLLQRPALTISRD